MPEATATKPAGTKPSQTSQTKPSETPSGAAAPASANSSATSGTGSTTPAAKRKERIKVDPNESNGAKFRRLGRQRVNRALNTIKLVGNLAAYNPDQQDAAKILMALTESVKEVELKFRAKVKGDARTFDL